MHSQFGHCVQCVNCSTSDTRQYSFIPDYSGSLFDVGSLCRPLRGISFHSWFFINGSHANTICLLHGAGRTKQKNSCWESGISVSQWLSSIVCHHRTLYSWLENAHLDCYSPRSAVVSFLEVSGHLAQEKPLPSPSSLHHSTINPLCSRMSKWSLKLGGDGY